MKQDEERLGSDFLIQRQLLITHSAEAFGLANAKAERTDGRWWLLLNFFPADRQPRIEATHVRVLGPEGRAAPHLQARRPVRPPGDKAPDASAAFLLAAEGDDARRLQIDTTPYFVELLEVENLDPFFSRAPLRFADGGSTSIELSAAERVLKWAESSIEPPPEDVDYLAKDYESFRTLMLDHMARSVPQWTERNASDLGVTIIEALAYGADYLSYYQDAVGTETYLETARRRISVRRHGVLLDYTLGEGKTPRAWIFVEVLEADGLPRDQPIWLPQGAQFLADSARKGVVPYPSLEYDRALRDGAEAFETLYGQMLRPSLNRLELYPWRVADFELELGATKATLEGDLTGRLRAGDIVLFEQYDAEDKETVDLSKRQVVRLCSDPRPCRDPLDPDRPLSEIEWHTEDALRFALPVRRHQRESEALAVVRGNLVLADIGRTTSELLPPVPLSRPYRPRLDNVGRRFRLVYHEPFLLEQAQGRPAAAAAAQEDENLLPAMTLIQLDESSWIDEGTVIEPLDSRRWSPSRDLIRSGRFARSFVVETENDGSVVLRFGDGSFGLKPEPNTLFWSFYRVADLKTSPIGPGTGACLVAAGTTGNGAAPVMPPDLEVRVGSASFPVGAMGGSLPETDEHARLFAPAYARRQERAVTAEDFADRARRLDQVKDAWARLQWGGSWTLATLRVQRAGGYATDEAFLDAVEEAFAGRLVMGYQLTVQPPLWVPLDIAMAVRLESHVDRHHVEGHLHRVFGTGLLENGAPAFFYPDAFGFGEDVELDDVVAAALAVDGVLDVEVTRFRPLAAATGDELGNGQIEIAPDQIASYGTLDFTWAEG